mmetsp:Transcript_47451/g.86893  ORF Transcript_47451/g.86893 Transcript_47451/m.86893 type:complete len:1413 (-) Transcript_47451:45-4283(-)
MTSCAMQGGQSCASLSGENAKMDDADFWPQFSAALGKHFLVAQRSRRWAWALLPPILCSGILCASWQVFLNTRWQARGYIFSTLGSLLLLLGMIPALQQNVVDLVSEKESKMKAMQTIYGLRRDAYWLSWLAYFFVCSVGSTAATLSLLTGFSGIFQHSDVQLLALVLLLGHLQIITVSCCLSVAFNKADFAARTMHFTSVVFVIFASGVCSIFRGGDSHMYYMASAVPTVSVHSALSSTFWLEAGDEGLRWHTLTAECCLPAGKDRTFLPVRDSIACTLLSLVAAAVLLLFVCRLEDRSRAKGPCVQKDGAGSKSAVSVVDLVKSFDGKVVVDHLTLDVRASEIFALLGHNGAGKTTIINCLAGLMQPTSGSTAVNGWSSQHDAKRAWQELSVCPQESPLHEELTVEEHLAFFGALRGEGDMSNQLAGLSGALTALGLGGKQHDLTRHLSGGQRRRLWVATALLGRTSVVVLDEPSSGMDPPARRDLWDYLLKMRAAGRTVVFTTHYLEEADWYAKRKAILAFGRVQAVGTSRELKVKFGAGYHLKVEVSAAASRENMAEELPESSAASPLVALPAVRELVLRHVPAATEAHSSEAVPFSSCRFVLPFSAINALGSLLGELDRLREERLADSSFDYSLQMTSLEDVFMKLGQDAADISGDSTGSGNTCSSAIDREARVGGVSAEASRQDVPFWESMLALARVRVISLCADSKTLKCQLLLPGILLLVAFIRSSKATSMSEPIFVILCPLCYSFAAAGVGALLVKEREMKCQLLCISQGLSARAYWIATLGVHATALLPLAGAVPILAAAFDTPYLNGPGLPLIVAECLIYPVVAVAFACAASLLFATAEGAMKCLPLLSFACVAVPSSAVFALRILGGAKRSASALADVLHYAFSLADPLYGLAGVLIHVISMSNPETQDNGGCSSGPYGGGQQCPKASAGPKSPPPGVLEHFASKAAFPLFCSPLVVVVMMAWLIRRGRPGAQSQATCPNGAKEENYEHKEDEDVAAEAQRIRRGLAQSQQVASPGVHGLATAPALEGDALTCVDLRHTYVAQEGFNHAVRGISLGIRSGERFGLLGPNGAGKTTTLSILTGELWPPTSGSIFVEGKNVAVAGHKVLYSRLGLCPQIDALWPELTGRQHLLFYGRVKGVPEEVLGAETEAILSRLGLTAHDADRRSETYSGGMKRKLAAGIALIGRPRLLVLDEPTAAVDAAGKRHLWQVIKQGGVHQTTLITTHSMEEAEALCDRVAIQVLGRIRCLGSPTRLRLRHGRGYRLELLTGSLEEKSMPGEKPEVAALSRQSVLENFVRDRISADAILVESGPGRCLFELPPSQPAGSTGAAAGAANPADATAAARAATLSPAAALTLIAAQRQALGIDDYCLWQPSLEQVFLRFAREQLDCEAPGDGVQGG